VTFASSLSSFRFINATYALMRSKNELDLKNDAYSTHRNKQTRLTTSCYPIIQLLKIIQSRPPIIPPCDGAKTNVKPTTIQRMERIARPEKVCIITETEFLLLMRPASKKPKAGIISMTKPVETSIHELSPALIGI
jgi:hypothetical protein